MFTGIIQSTASIVAIEEKEGIRVITLDFKNSFCDALAVGASVSVDGVCLTATTIHSPQCVTFDVMLQSLITTTLSDAIVGSVVNVERAAKEGAEVGGHPLSGHIDGCGKIITIATPQNNKVLRIEVAPSSLRYIFSKGYIALDGASLTVSELNRSEHWFEVWLIPETRRVTTFDHKKIGDKVNIEIDRNTQIIVDTVHSTIEEGLSKFLPAFSKQLLESQMIDTMTPLLLPENL